MPVPVNFPYKVGVSTLYFVVLNEAQAILDKTTGLFEVPVPGNEIDYRVALVDANALGAYYGLIPAIDLTELPRRVAIYIYDSADLDPDDPIGVGYVTIDEVNNEVNTGIIRNMSSDKAFACIYASTVGNNLGVGTSTEQYYGPDDALTFTSVFDSNGNRQVTVE